MTNKLTAASKLTVIGVSLLAGFLGGVIFTVYKSPSITSQLAGASSQQGSDQMDWPQHISHLKESIDEDPDNADTWSQLANAYYEMQDYPQSIAAYLKLITLVDKKSAAYQDLGVVYRKDGQFDKSIEAFEKAVAHDAENYQALFNIGVVQYHDLDDEAGAKETWKKVALIKPDFQLSTGQSIQQLVENLK